MLPQSLESHVPALQDAPDVSITAVHFLESEIPAASLDNSTREMACEGSLEDWNEGDQPWYTCLYSPVSLEHSPAHQVLEVGAGGGGVVFQVQNPTGATSMGSGTNYIDSGATYMSSGATYMGSEATYTGSEATYMGSEATYTGSTLPHGVVSSSQMAPGMMPSSPPGMMLPSPAMPPGLMPMSPTVLSGILPPHPGGMVPQPAASSFPACSFPVCTSPSLMPNSIYTLAGPSLPQAGGDSVTIKMEDGPMDRAGVEADGSDAWMVDGGAGAAIWSLKVEPWRTPHHQPR